MVDGWRPRRCHPSSTTASAALPLRRCHCLHHCRAAAATNTVLLPSCRRRHQAGRRPLAAAALPLLPLPPTSPLATAVALKSDLVSLLWRDQKCYVCFLCFLGACQHFFTSAQIRYINIPNYPRVYTCFDPPHICHVI